MRLLFDIHYVTLYCITLQDAARLLFDEALLERVDRRRAASAGGDGDDDGGDDAALALDLSAAAHAARARVFGAEQSWRELNLIGARRAVTYRCVVRSAVP